MTTPLYTLLRPERLTEVVDIGANPAGHSVPTYKPMLDAGLCRVTGFEPNPEAFTQLLHMQGSSERYLPFVVGDGKRHGLNIYPSSKGLLSSLFEIDPVIFDFFPEFKQWTESSERVEIQTRRLDDITEIETLDYLKIDVQGSELAVFQSGKAKLANTLVIQTEVSFITIYKGQPTFGEVDFELRRQGFIPHCLAEVQKWPISPLVAEDSEWKPLNQLLEADIVYVRDFFKMQFMSDEQLKHLALIAHHCYQSFDLALRCVMLLEQRAVLKIGAQQVYRSLIGHTPLGRCKTFDLAQIIPSPLPVAS
jgi:FkbM family methyltransferase